MLKGVLLFTVLMIFGLISNPYLVNAEIPEYELSENDMEWCDEVYSLYETLGLQWFLENHHYSIEARVCGSLYQDPVWTEASGEDRYKQLQERSKYYVALEIQESEIESEKGVDDPTPVAVSDPDLANTTEPREELKESKSMNDEKPMLEETPLSPQQGGGCLIATATYDSEFAPQVQQLREIREKILLKTNSGISFMSGFNQVYYLFSPTIADWERENFVFKELVKITITPLIMSLSILNYVDINSEAEVLGYGISIISLNIGIYFVMPALIVIKLKRKWLI